MIFSSEMTRKEKAEADPVPTESYIQLLKKYCELAGINWKDVRVSEMTHSRLFNLDKPTLSAANRYAQALRERGYEMPPAAVPVVDEVDHEWITRGRELREAKPERFDEMLQILREFAVAARQDIEATARLRILVGGQTTKTDKVPDGDGVK